MAAIIGGGSWFVLYLVFLNGSSSTIFISLVCLSLAEYFVRLVFG